MHIRRTYTSLTLAGTLPFVAGAALAFANIQDLPVLGATEALVISYGLAIVCFLTGTHWGMQIVAETRAPGYLLILSNLLFLVAWIGYLLLPAAGAALVLAGTFGILLLVDHRLLDYAVIERPYFQMRTLATIVAIVSLLVIAAV